MKRLTPFENLLELVTSEEQGNRELALIMMVNFKKEFREYFPVSYDVFLYICKKNNLDEASFLPIMFTYLEDFAEKSCGIYDSRLSDKFNTASGWLELKRMVRNKIRPNEINMRVFHANLRPYLVKYWFMIQLFKIKYS